MAAHRGGRVDRSGAAGRGTRVFLRLSSWIGRAPPGRSGRYHPHNHQIGCREAALRANPSGGVANPQDDEAERRERDEFQRLDLAAWPDAELRPSENLWNRLAERIGNEGWSAVEAELPLSPQWSDLEWQRPAPGIYCKILAADAEHNRVSLIVRLDPGIEYPAHTHAGVEELHLLDGELWIDDRKLCPGDFSRAMPGTSDSRAWSDTGCTCVLITSPGDVLR